MPFTTINGRNLHHTVHEASSPGSSLHVILVHGLGSTSSFYYPILPYLSEYTCITFDNYGAGRSSYSPDEEQSIEKIGSDVIGLLDHLNVEKAIVGGYSMGGMVPTYLAATKPDRVLAAVCIGPVHPSQAVADIFGKRIETVRANGIEAMASTIPNAALGSKATPLQRSFVREMIMSQNPEGYCANCKAIEKATPPEYAKVKCPVLIVAGEEDKSAPLTGCKFILESIGGDDKNLEVLNGVGHWHCVEAAHDVGSIVKEFCDRFA